MHTPLQDMIQPPLTLAPDATVQDAIAVMHASQASCVLVLDQQHLVGIVTKGVILQALMLSSDLNQCSVQTVMTQPVITLTESAYQGVRTTLSILKHHKIQHLPILNDASALVGVITSQALLEAWSAEEPSTDVAQSVPVKAPLPDVRLQQEVIRLQQLTEELTHRENEYHAVLTEQKQVETTLQRQLARERLIVSLTQQIHQSLKLEEILSTAVEEVREFLQADRVLVYQLDSKDARSVIAESVSRGELSILGQVINDPALTQQPNPDGFRIGHISLIENVETDDISPIYRACLKRLQVHASLTVPILQESGKFWGLLLAHNCSEPRIWQPSDVSLLRQLATQLAIALKQAELYEQLQLANQALRRLATSDSLTKLANRRHFDDSLTQEWKRLARDCSPLSLILCDVDFFKRYNDHYGHQAGDECLIQIAGALNRAARRPADLVARYGGEEFALILPNTSSIGAVRVVKKIQAEMNALQIPHPASDVSDLVTLSIGIASIAPNLHDSPDRLIAATDQALYHAKRQGRNTYSVQSTSIMFSLEEPEP
jgi:diguanylate cyclase (GGDEF)-like protein